MGRHVNKRTLRHAGRQQLDARLPMLVSAVLATVLVSPLLAGSAAAETVSQTLIAFNSQWHAGIASGPETPTITIKPGDTLQLRIENHDQLFHTFSIPHFGIDRGLDNGTTNSPTVITITLTTASGDEGRWQFHCRPHSSGGNENRQGMVGWLEIRKPPSTPGFEVWGVLAATTFAFILVGVSRRRI